MISKRRKQRVTKKKASIKLGNTWPNYIIIILISIALGFGIGFNIFDGGRTTNFILRIGELEAENKSLEDNLVKRDLEIKLQNMSNKKNINELESIKKENNELKEEILFYEKIVGKRKK
tara:strand:- start:13384 stop:13740 length:357 start_codon:yes stop_codon:yes gene_type:complete